MEVEMESIKRNNVWELVELPKGRSSVEVNGCLRRKLMRKELSREIKQE